VGECDWQKFVEFLVDNCIVTWKEVASTILGAINPPQVGTSVASNKSFQKAFKRRGTWQAVKKWFYRQPFGCRKCGTLVKLEVEHIIAKSEGGGDTLGNLQLLCKRCNMGKRPSHKKACITPLTTEAALMWILFTEQPDTYEDYEKLCREYGLTMANIRFQEAWAMAEWFSKIDHKISAWEN
jgi:hypothetical protein